MNEIFEGTNDGRKTKEGAAKKMERLPKRMANLECNEQNTKVKHRVEGNRLFNGRRDE